MKDFLRSRLNKRQAAAVIVIAALLIVWCLLQIVRVKTVQGLDDVRGAERFAPDGGYAQVACYFTDTAQVSVEREKEFSYLVEDLLTRNAIEPKAGARLFVDCYTVSGRARVAHNGKSAAADAIGTGGDFFFLHPVELISGMYYSADALTADQVLIDESLAWQLFGGMDIAGQTVEIGGQLHVIRGVVKTAAGRLRTAAGAGEALIYLPAASLIEYGTPRGGEAYMSCYEVVMPDPVDKFAVSQIKEAFRFDETMMEVVNNTTRFHNFALLDILKTFGTRSMTNSAIWYPYWENVARGTEDILVIVMALQALCILIPVIIVTVMIVQAYRHKRWTARGVVTALSDRIYGAQAKLREKNKTL